MRKRTEAEEEGEGEQTEVVVANEADDLDNNQVRLQVVCNLETLLQCCIWLVPSAWDNKQSSC